MNLHTSFSCYLLSVMTLNICVLRKHQLLFEFCQYFILFLSTLRAVSVKGRKQYPVGNKLMYGKFSCSTIGFFVFILRLFNFLSITAYFMSSFCFLFILSHY